MKKTWDNPAINQVFESLIDTTGIILDQYHLYQLHRITKAHPLLNCFVNLLEYIEKELLVQWKIKQENGLEQLFEHQRCWYHSEIRSQGIFFELWNEFVQEHLKASKNYPLIQKNNIWKSLILVAMSDQEKIANVFPISGTSNLQKIVLFFKNLYLVDPFNHILGYLNIVELGLGFRPEIMEPAIEKVQSNKSINISTDLKLLADSLSTIDNWHKADQLLQQFWLSKPEGA